MRFRIYWRTLRNRYFSWIFLDFSSFKFGFRFQRDMLHRLIQFQIIFQSTKCKICLGELSCRRIKQQLWAFWLQPCEKNTLVSLVVCILLHAKCTRKDTFLWVSVGHSEYSVQCSIGLVSKGVTKEEVHRYHCKARFVVQEVAKLVILLFLCSLQLQRLSTFEAKVVMTQERLRVHVVWLTSLWMERIILLIKGDIMSSLWMLKQVKNSTADFVWPILTTTKQK